jgi:hypothetical protein
MEVKEFEKLKQEYDQLVKQSEKDDWTLQSLMKDLQDTYKVASLKEASTLLQSLEQESAMYEQEKNSILAKLKEIA